MGGVGLSAVMGARAAGTYPIIAVDRVPDKLKLARELGATHTIQPPWSTIPWPRLRRLDAAAQTMPFESVAVTRRC